MKIATCQPYHAQTVGHSLLRMPDQRSVFKVYYLSLIERDNPKRYEWQHSSLTQSEFEKTFLQDNHEGIGFIIAFPHIAKVFRFSPYGETILDVRGYYPEGMRVWNGTREDGSQEFGCLAEIIIAADEYVAWANAVSVEEYLAFRCDKIDFPLVHHTKLSRYWETVAE